MNIHCYTTETPNVAAMMAFALPALMYKKLEIILFSQ